MKSISLRTDMSTKIYTGFLIETDSLARITEMVDAFRPIAIRWSCTLSVST